jgi:N-formylglutamate amidohydrolase
MLDERSIRSSEDAFMDMLVERRPGLGAPLLAAEYPRAYIDLNRSDEELDPGVIEGVGRVVQTPRISSGLGVIPRVVANGRAIYRGKLPGRRPMNGSRSIWQPYHGQLDRLMQTAHDRFGEAVILDFHSMPHEALDSVARPGSAAPRSGSGRPVRRLGAGRSGRCAGDGLPEAGLVVSRNAPFAGAYVAQRYGRPARGWHAVQIEIDRSLYMNERMIRPNGNFDNVQADRDRGDGARDRGAPGAMPLAAE